MYIDALPVPVPDGVPRSQRDLAARYFFLCNCLRCTRWRDDERLVRGFRCRLHFGAPAWDYNRL